MKFTVGSKEDWTQFGLSLLVGLVALIWAIAGDRYINAGSFGGVLLLSGALIKSVATTGRLKKEARLQVIGFVFGIAIFVAVMAGRQDVDSRLPFLAWHIVGLTTIPAFSWWIFTLEARSKKKLAANRTNPS